MKIGDVIELDGSRWKISTHNSLYRLFTVVQANGTKREVPDDLDVQDYPDIAKATVLFNPANDWPFLTIPVRAKAGPVQKVTINRGFPRDLAPMIDWIPSDFMRAGGSIFFNPELRLRAGEVLVAVHQNGSLSRLNVTSAFATVRRRQIRAAKPAAQKPSNVYDRLMGQDPFEDE